MKWKTVNDPTPRKHEEEEREIKIRSAEHRAALHLRNARGFEETDPLAWMYEMDCYWTWILVKMIAKYPELQDRKRRIS